MQSIGCFGSNLPVKRLIEWLRREIRYVERKPLRGGDLWRPVLSRSRTAVTAGSLAILARLLHTKRLKVVTSRVTAMPLPSVQRPVLRWSPGDALPNFGAISWQLVRRWKEPARRVTVWHATRYAAQQFGGRGRGRLKLPDQATHDLGVSQVYLYYLTHDAKRAVSWIGEDLLPSRRGEKHPDAIIQDEPSGTKLVIEFGGQYPAERVAAFHEDCEAKGLCYELW
jgi:hypothetical protein